MAIHVEVLAELNKRSVEKAATEIQARFDKVGFEVSPELDKKDVEAVALYLEKRFDHIDAKVHVDYDRNSISQANQGFRELERVTGAATRSLGGFNSGAKDASATLGTMGKTAFGATRGLITVLAPLAGIVAIDFAQWAVQASGALGLIPAVAATAAAGIGTVALATQGFSDAIKDIRDPDKFATALASLAPAAQQAALEIRNLLPEFDALKNAVQDTFFTGIAEQIHNLTNTFLPSIQGMTTSIASSFNQMFTGITSQIMTDAGRSQMQDIFDNIAKAFQNLVPGAQAFSQAILDITQVGSGFLPGLAQSVSELATNFAEFIRNARDSGQLQQWISTGIEAVKMLGTELWKISGSIIKLFGNGGDGQGAIDNFKKDLESINDVLKILNGDFSGFGDELIMMFNRWGDALQHYVIDKLNALIDRVNTIPGIGRLFPDIPHVQEYQTPFTGGGGSFGPAPDTHWFGKTPIPWKPGAPMPPPPGGQPGFGGGLGYNTNTGAGAGLGPYAPSVVPAPPPVDANGKPLSDKDKRDAYIATLDPSQYKVDPFAGMLAGAGGPMAAYGQSGYQAKGPLDPQAILEAQHNVISQAHDQEEDTKNLLALKHDNTATQEEINDAQWKVTEDGWALQKAQADLADKLQGTAKSTKSGMDDLSAALDPDLGLSKGLSGLADNLVRFLGHVALAGPMAKMQQTVNNDPTKGGYGFFGIHGAQNMAQGNSPILGRPYDNTGGGYGSSNGGGYPSAYTNNIPNYGAQTAALPQYGGGGGGGGGPAAIPASYGGGIRPPLKGNFGAEGWRGTVTDVVARYADQMGIPPGQRQAWVNAIVTQIATESSGNPGAFNGADPNGQGGTQTVQGLLQYLPSSYANSGGKLTGLPYLDPIGQIAGALFAPRNPDGSPNFNAPGHIGTPGLGWGPAAYNPGPAPAAPTPAAPTPGNPYANLAPLIPPLTPQKNPPPFYGTPPGAAPPGPTDIVPALLTPGETVLPAPTPGGADPRLLRLLGVPGFAGGGYIDQNGNPVAAGAAPGPQYGGLEPPSNPGGGGVGMTPGGTLDTAISMAASAADIFAPGAGQAAQTGIKLANRAIQYAGQLAGIGVSGLMETFLPTGGSELANNSWLTRLAGGLAGASPQIPNAAGGASGGGPPVNPFTGQQPAMAPGALTPEMVAAAGNQHGMSGGAAPGPTVINYTAQGQTEDQHGNNLAWHIDHSNAASMGGMGTPR